MDAAASVLHPFEVAAERVARPFRDAYGWFESLFDARSEAERLREENERLRQTAISNTAGPTWCASGESFRAVPRASS